jgi:hypothetical protein
VRPVQLDRGRLGMHIAPGAGAAVGAGAGLPLNYSGMLSLAGAARRGWGKVRGAVMKSPALTSGLIKSLGSGSASRPAMK